MVEQAEGVERVTYDLRDRPGHHKKENTVFALDLKREQTLSHKGKRQIFSTSRKIESRTMQLCLLPFHRNSLRLLDTQRWTEDIRNGSTSKRIQACQRL